MWIYNNNNYNNNTFTVTVESQAYVPFRTLLPFIKDAYLVNSLATERKQLYIMTHFLLHSNLQNVVYNIK